MQVRQARSEGVRYYFIVAGVKSEIAPFPGTILSSLSLLNQENPRNPILRMKQTLIIIF